jgi:homoserine dehydrogenase
MLSRKKSKLICGGRSFLFPSHINHSLAPHDRYPYTHPFCTSLGGSDNIIAFHTARYSPRPLIIQGAGAGADVTAMGVLGDAFKLIGL